MRLIVFMNAEGEAVMLNPERVSLVKEAPSSDYGPSCYVSGDGYYETLRGSAPEIATALEAGTTIGGSRIPAPS